MIRKWLSFRSLSIALALVLLFTAVLKLHLLLTDSFADIKTGNSLPLLWLAVFAELGVVWIVFSMANDRLKWLALISLFSVMSVFSTYNICNGKTNCGCAGSVEIHPAWVLGFDLVAVSLLFALRRQLSVDSVRTTFSILSKNLGLYAGFLTVAIVFIAFQSRTLRNSLTFGYFQDSIKTAPIQLGKIAVGKSVKCKLQLCNRSKQDRRIVGLNTSCKCLVPDEVVVHSTIAGQSDREINFMLFSNRVGSFHFRVLFFLDSPRQHVVAADLFAQFEEF
ncbi:MAG: hypothetical protein ABL888_14315 [Pirellulaceae bacterium]